MTPSSSVSSTDSLPSPLATGSYFGDVTYKTDSGSLKSDHSMLNSLASMPTPPLVDDAFASPIVPPVGTLGGRNGFPLLPPHHPLRHKMQHLDVGRLSPPSPVSPPTTPKGHPLDSSFIRFPKVSPPCAHFQVRC
jgi:hypothetical protein